MDLTDKVKIGQVVKSKAGRDSGRVFLILSILDEEYVEVVDGDLRTLNRPKKKKIKHLAIYNSIAWEFSDKLNKNIEINDAIIRRILEPYKGESKSV